MDWIINNWYVIVGAIVSILAIVIVIKNYLDLPNSTKLSKLREWLLYAVLKAEKELGGGTGQIKLRYVYDMFISKFKFLSIFINFDIFSKLVDEALVRMAELLKDNSSISDLIIKEGVTR